MFDTSSLLLGFIAAAILFVALFALYLFLRGRSKMKAIAVRKTIYQDYFDFVFEYDPSWSDEEFAAQFQPFYDRIGIVYEIGRKGAQAEIDRKKEEAKKKAEGKA